MAKKITELNNDSKAFLLSKTPYILPDNPSSKGFSANQVRQSMYGGYVVIYEWLRKMGLEANDAITELNDDIDSIRETTQIGGSEFVPALQEDEPNFRKTKVWLQTQDDIPKEVVDYDEGTQEYSFSDDGAEAYSFGNTQADGEYSFADDDDAADGYTFGDES